MKYIVILGDGMADRPLPQLDNQTPLQCAYKPHMDFLAQNGKTGLVHTVPQGIAPGSDVANLSVMGYDPALYYTGRSPLEAVSMGVQLSDTDVAFRCNLVTLAGDGAYEDKVMSDYSADEISTEEARQLIEDVNCYLQTEDMVFHPGISYRHCMIWHQGPTGLGLTPPHDILERKINPYLPQGAYGELLLSMMKKSAEFLPTHPINLSRVSRGLRPANSIWLWGEGKRPAVPSFQEKYGLQGSVISAVDLIKGLGICAGLSSIEVEGATGNYHTNFKGKALAALQELENGKDFVYIHIEAPDECGHRFEIENKVKSIERIDADVVGTLLEGLQKYEDFRLLILPDHPTPLSLRTHTSDPVPFIIYQKSQPHLSGVHGYDEFQAAATGLTVTQGHRLMDTFIGEGL